MINVIDANGVTQSIGTLPDLGVAAAPGALPFVGVAASTTGSISALNANLLTGTATAGSSVEIDTKGYNTLTVQVTGTFGTGGTLTIQGTLDGINWVSIGTSRIHTFAGTSSSTIIAAGIYFTDVTGFTRARVTMSALTSGTPTIAVTLNLSAASGVPTVLGAVATVSSVSSVSAANLAIPGIIADVATTTTLTSNSTTASTTITPTFGCSYEVNIPVTVFSGTGLSLDVIIQESDDTGTNWFDVYQFERITGTGIYRSPKLPLTGNRIRYVQIVTGTITTLTRAINRLQSSDSVFPVRRFFDRSLNSAQALNAVTSGNTVVSSITYPYTMGNPGNSVQLVVSTATLGGTPPAFRLQGSEDNTNWYDLSATSLTAIAGTAQQTVGNVRAPFLRAYVTTAGVGTTLNYICIKAYE